MTDKLLDDRDMSFLLYELLDSESLSSRSRSRCAEHSRETYDAAMDTARTIAAKFCADHNAKGDANEPVFDGDTVSLTPETHAAWDAFAEAGFLAAHYDLRKVAWNCPR